jgi:hypothetical protein
MSCIAEAVSQAASGVDESLSKQEQPLQRRLRQAGHMRLPRRTSYSSSRVDTIHEMVSRKKRPVLYKVFLLTQKTSEKE